MQGKPILMELLCPICLEEAQVLWVQSGENRVTWCAAGHVVVTDKDEHKEVYNFAQ